MLTYRETSIAGLFVGEARPIEDARGHFARLFCAGELNAVIGSRSIVQINHSVTNEVGAIRGLHFQIAPYTDMKIVRCLRGRVWDVAVDVRRGSLTYLSWVAKELSPNNRRMMIIPEGCAHGFQVMEPKSELLYLHTSAYSLAAEQGIRFDDPSVGIAWPIPATVMSDRDRGFPLIAPDFTPVVL